MANQSIKKQGKKVRKTVPNANVYVTASFNNTTMTITDPEGNTLAWSTAGASGFKGSRKSTPYAATVTAEKLIQKIEPHGIQKIRVFIRGVGAGREQSVRALQAAGLELEAIFDVTPVPHNGCRKKRMRRP